MRHTSKLLAVLGLTLLLAPMAAAQITSAQVGAFGTQTRVGDADYMPLLKASKAWAIAEVDLGVSGDVRDNCIVLMHDVRPLAGAFPSQTGSPINKDIRLTPCQGKPAGSVIGDVDVVEKQATYTVYPAAGAATTLAAQTIASTPPSPGRFSLSYGDVDGNGKYGKGDAVYLSVGTPQAGDLLVATSATGAWTLRITPSGTFPAGSFVLLGDRDWPVFHASGATKNDKAWLVAEREDKGWYLFTQDSACCFSALPVTATSTLRPGTPLPVNAIRISSPGLFSLQPSIIVTGAELANPDGAEAGKPMPVIVTMTNNGATAGYGVLVTKLDKQIVDVRMSPLLSPGEFTKTILTVAQVPYGGQQELEVNDVFLPISVKGTTAATTPSSASGTDVAALQAQIATMQSRLATLEASGVEPTVAKGSPSVAPLAAFGCLAAVALILRRRAA